MSDKAPTLITELPSETCQGNKWFETHMLTGISSHKILVVPVCLPDEFAPESTPVSVPLGGHFWECPLSTHGFSGVSIHLDKWCPGPLVFSAAMGRMLITCRGCAAKMNFPIPNLVDFLSDLDVWVLSGTRQAQEIVNSQYIRFFPDDSSAEYFASSLKLGTTNDDTTYYLALVADAQLDRHAAAAACRILRRSMDESAASSTKQKRIRGYR